MLESDINDYKPEYDQETLVRKALENPIGTRGLADLARGKKKIVVIASDHTRPVPSKYMIPPMLAEIRKGSPEADITILVATGCHRETTREELRDKFGDRVMREEKIVVHDCDDLDAMVRVGVLPSGGELVLNKRAVEAELLVAEGFIEPHFFAGFSGGRKSVLPGVATRQTVLYNHNASFIASDRARTGVLEDNPIHNDMLYAARAAGLDFILNVVINSQKEIIAAVAGAWDAAHAAGCDFLSERCRVSGRTADIVVTTNGGYPLDQNIYQAVKGMTAAETVVRKDGVIIIFAKSNDGHGGVDFYDTFGSEKDLAAIMAAIMATPSNETIPDQWQSQIFARVLQHARVIYISDAPDAMVRGMRMIPAHSFSEALALADGILGSATGTVSVIPDGVSVIMSRKE
jgi:nickel-dependent lactate racemase